MKNYILLLILVLTTGIGIAQSGFDNIQVKNYKPIKKSAVDDLLEFVSEDETGYHAIGIKKKIGLVGGRSSRSVLIQLDKEMNVLESVWLDKLYESKHFDYEDRVYSGDNMYFFTSHLDKKKSKREIFIQKYIPSRMSFSAPKKFGETILDPNSKETGGLGAIVKSNDSSLVLIQNLEPYKKKSYNIFSYFVADKDMNILYENRCVFDGSHSIGRILRVDISNSGNVIVLGGHTENEDDVKGGDNTIKRYNIIVISDKGEILNDFAIECGDKRLVNFEMECLNDNSIVISGYFRHATSRFGSIDGVFYKRYASETYVEEASSFIDFTSEFKASLFTQQETKREAGGKPIELNNIFTRRFYFNEDGSVVFFGERMIKKEQEKQVYTDPNDRFKTTPGANSHTPGANSHDYSQVKTTYFYYGILVVSFNPKGELTYAVTIPKFQKWVDSTRMLSFSTIKKGEDFYLIFNDHPDNLSMTTGEPALYGELTKSYVCVTKVDKYGTVTRKELANPDGKKFSCLPRNMLRVNGKSYMPISKGVLNRGVELITIEID